VAPKATGAVLSDAASPPAGSGDGSGASLTSVKTTSGRIAVSNLDGQIEELTKLLDKSARRADMLQGLATLLPVRAQFLGKVEDYDLALADAEALVALRPKDPKAYLTRAHARSSLHEFKDASVDLDQATTLGGTKLADEIDAARASILQATGHTAEAQEILQRLAKNNPEILTMGALGLTLADQGKIDEADAVLAKAPLSYFGGLPFPVAWIEFQRGWLWERQGQPTKAIGYYRTATERLPDYAVAQAHMAGLIAAEGDRAKGIALLRQVTQTASDRRVREAPRQTSRGLCRSRGPLLPGTRGQSEARPRAREVES
jgi:tetratricopeptide (TPR) repeat protein